MCSSDLDRIALMNKGKIEQLGTVDDLYYHPRTHFVADFIGETNLFPCQISGRKDDRTTVKIGDRHELHLAPLSVRPDTREVLLSIRPEKIQIQHQPFKGENCYPAMVLEEIFKGPADELVLGLEPSAQGVYPVRLHSLVPNYGTDKQLIHRGDRVFAKIHPDDIVVVEEK